jgi:hypothetical protein
MSVCVICFNRILAEETVEILLRRSIDYKHIIGKYYWVQCDYCFNCLLASRKMLWRYFLSLLLGSNTCESITCHNPISNECQKSSLATILYYGLPERLTDNLRLDGRVIYSIYYRNKMYSAKLETGLSDFAIQHFKDKLFNLNKVITENEEKENKKQKILLEFNKLFNGLLIDS